MDGLGPPGGQLAMYVSCLAKYLLRILGAVRVSPNGRETFEDWEEELPSSLILSLTPGRRLLLPSSKHHGKCHPQWAQPVAIILDSVFLAIPSQPLPRVSYDRRRGTLL